MHAKKKHRELRRIIDRDIATEPTSAEKVELPPPVKLGASLADKLRAALGQCYDNKRGDLKPAGLARFDEDVHATDSPVEVVDADDVQTGTLLGTGRRIPNLTEHPQNTFELLTRR
jgi:hypothetical protein